MIEYYKEAYKAASDINNKKGVLPLWLIINQFEQKDKQLDFLMG